MAKPKKTRYHKTVRELMDPFFNVLIDGFESLRNCWFEFVLKLLVSLGFSVLSTQSWLCEVARPFSGGFSNFSDSARSGSFASDDFSKIDRISFNIKRYSSRSQYFYLHSSFFFCTETYQNTLFSFIVLMQFVFN